MPKKITKRPDCTVARTCERDCDSMNKLLAIYGRGNKDVLQHGLCSCIVTLMGDYENGQRPSDAPGLGKTIKRIKAASNATQKLLHFLDDIKEPSREMMSALVGIAVRAKLGAFFDEARNKGCETTIEDIFPDKFLTALEMRLRCLQEALDMPLEEILQARKRDILRRLDPPDYNVKMFLNPADIPKLSPENLLARSQLRETMEKLLSDSNKKLLNGGRPIKPRELTAKCLADVLLHSGVNPRPQLKFAEFLREFFEIVGDNVALIGDANTVSPLVKSALEGIPSPDPRRKKRG